MFGIVYATDSKAIRRIIALGRDDKIENHPVSRGETLLFVRSSGPYDLESCKTLVEQATGVRPPDPSCAVVDGRNIVIAMIAAEATLDSHPEGELITAYSTEIGVGDAYARQAEVFIRPAQTIPAGTIDKTTGLPSTEDVVIPARVLTR